MSTFLQKKQMSMEFIIKNSSGILSFAKNIRFVVSKPFEETGRIAAKICLRVRKHVRNMYVVQGY